MNTIGRTCNFQTSKFVSHIQRLLSIVNVKFNSKQTSSIGIIAKEILTSVERLHLIWYNNWPKISNDQINYYALNLCVFCSLPMRLVLEQLWYHQQGNWLNRCVN